MSHVPRPVAAVRQVHYHRDKALQD